MAIALDSTTRSLTVVLAGAKTSLDAQFIATYEDRPVSPALGNTALAVPFTNQGTTNGVTAAVVMPSPAGLPAYRRVLKSLQFNNVDTGAITVTFNFVDTAGSTTKLVTFVLQTGEYIGYEDGYGFDVFDVNGALKSQNANTSAATSTAQAAGSQASSMASIALLGSRNPSIEHNHAYELSPSCGETDPSWTRKERTSFAPRQRPRRTSFSSHASENPGCGVHACRVRMLRALWRPRPNVPCT